MLAFQLHRCPQPDCKRKIGAAASRHLLNRTTWDAVHTSTMLVIRLHRCPRPDCRQEIDAAALKCRFETPAQPQRVGRPAHVPDSAIVSLHRCPQPDCKREIDAAALRHLLSRSEWAAVLDVAAEAALPADQRLYCPYATCSALMVKGTQFGKKGETACPHCKG